ncbi:MAG: DNA translocase FtsK 4TM domain-containing protein, partial [Salinisphaeraceae bacterium]|nr:DNA translocase FtsK 4TM domain-containing protein [Salinisphaeraceae bacterium]
MAKAGKKSSKKTADKAHPYTERLGHGAREALLLFSAAVTIYLLMALISYSSGDPGWSSRGYVGSVENLGGRAGAWFADVLLSLFGYMAFVLPWLVLYSGWMVFRGGRDASFRGSALAIRTVSLIVFLISGCAILDLVFGGTLGTLPQAQGGIVGHVIGAGLVSVFNVFGALWLLFALWVVSSSMGVGFSWLGIVDRLGGWTLARFASLRERYEVWQANRAEAAAAAAASAGPEIRIPPNVDQAPVKKPAKRKAAKAEPKEEQLSLPMGDDKDLDIPSFNPAKDAPIPPIDLLEKGRSAGRSFTKDELDSMSRQVEDSLAHFGIDVTVVAVEPGPVITRFELDLAPGVKVNQVTNLSKDIARALSTSSVRVVEVIPGKPYIGLEIPNQERAIVSLREIFESPKYQQSGSSLTLALGKDISGNAVVADLARMPHLLVAGATGAGKSVAINVMILSLLYRVPASDVRIIMIDPKMLELSV